MGEAIRVVLVDDQELVRAGLALVIDSQPDMRVVGQAGTGADAVALVRARECDVVLMDVRMPQLDGIEATARILADADARGRAAPKIVMLTTYDLDEYLLRAIRAGASGFLLKNAPPADLLAAIRTVHAGDAVIAPSSTKKLIEHVAAQRAVSPDGIAAITGLTDREREVLALIAQGKSNAEIAGTLYLGETTVKTHVRHVLAKLGARDRIQAVVMAHETGWLATLEKR